jgi:DNA repair protein RecN (Recombination protein N)
MVQRLYIKNYAIIDELAIDFADGLTIITGETGAGKSILLGALGLIMGKRADTKSLYAENEKCVVEAYFSIGRYELRSFFEAEDIDYDEELVIRREITPSGKSRAFVNDTPTTLKVLQALTGELVDLHQQFDTLDINSMSFQLKMVDALANNKELLRSYRQGYQTYQADKKELAERRKLDEQGRREVDFIEFQLNEFNEAELVAGEQEELEDELSRLTNAEDIKQTLHEVYQGLSERETSIIGQLDQLQSALQQVSDYDQELRKLQERFDSLLLELNDLAGEFEQVGESTEHNPERIQEVQTRLDLIYRLQNKHSVATVEELLNIQEKLQRQLATYQDLSDGIFQLEARIEERESQLIKLAESLSERRKSVVDNFSKKVEDMLAQLAMPHARIEVQFSVMQDLGPNGWDEVRFLFAANKGSRLQEIKDVASGGELSRLALVIKSLVASAIPLPSLIFDEIDSGISGDVALKMGTILRKLSNEHQVITITHSPQIASRADRHYFVFKDIREERTVTKVRLLEDDARIEAIATMLSQDPPSASAIENAKELLSQV